MSVGRSFVQPIPYFFAAPGTVQFGEINIFTESSIAGEGTFVPTSNTSALSTLVAAGGLLKDMGRTIVSTGRTFRKVAFLSAGLSNTEGIVGLDTLYEAFYVELGIPTFDAAPNATLPSGIVRYF